MDSADERNDLLHWDTENSRLMLVLYRPTKSEVFTLIERTTFGIGTLGILALVVRVLIFGILGKQFT